MPTKTNLIVFHDTETTGARRSSHHLDGGDKILESAFAVYKYNESTGRLTYVEYLEEQNDPCMPIAPGAAMTHGIWYPDLKGKPVFSKTKSFVRLQELIDDGAYYCAHNSPFDIAMLKKEGIEWPEDKVIDTLNIARFLETSDEIESKSLQWLRYFYNFDEQKDFPALVKKFGIKRLQAHTALSDIVVLIYYFKKIVKDYNIKTLSELTKLSSDIVIEKTIEFGNIFDKGTLYEDIVGTTYSAFGKMKTAESYLNWAVSNMDNMSMDRKISISYFVIKAYLSGKIKKSNDIIPMIMVASSFIPEFWVELENFGIPVESQRNTVYGVISEKINNLNAEALKILSSNPSNADKIKATKTIEKAFDLQNGFNKAKLSANNYKN